MSPCSSDDEEMNNEMAAQLTTPTTPPSALRILSESLELSSQGLETAKQLSSSDKLYTLCNRGLTRALSFDLAAVFGIEPERIEIGATTLSKHGTRTHCVHYLCDFEDLKPSRGCARGSCLQSRRSAWRRSGSHALLLPAFLATKELAVACNARLMVCVEKFLCPSRSVLFAKCCPFIQENMFEVPCQAAPK